MVRYLFYTIGDLTYQSPLVPLHPPFYPPTVNSSKPLQQLYPPFCPPRGKSKKPSQPLLPPSCHQRVKSSKPSQPLYPPTQSYVFTHLHNHIMRENIPGLNSILDMLKEQAT